MWYYDPDAPNVIDTYWADVNEYGFCQITQQDPATGLVVGVLMAGNVATTGNFTFKMLRSTAAHELGHGIGLAHSTVTPAVMNTQRRRWEVYMPESDDITGVNSLYPR